MTQPGELWLFHKHRLLCADCHNPEKVTRLMQGEIVSMAFLGPFLQRRIGDAVGRAGVIAGVQNGAGEVGVGCVQMRADSTDSFGHRTKAAMFWALSGGCDLPVV